MHYIKVLAFAIAVIFAVSCTKTKVHDTANKPIEEQGVDENRDKKGITASEINRIWMPQLNSAKEIIALYDSLGQAIAKEASDLHILNQCHFVWQSGEYMFNCRGKNSDIYQLPKHSTPLSLDNSIVAEFAKGHTTKKGKFVDHYFTLQAMKRGEGFDESRDGITSTVFYPIRALNDNDYDKLRTIFTSKNSALHNEYLERLKFPLANSGCTDGLKSIQPLIEQNVAESKLKSEILEIYSIYSRIRPGEPAPISQLKDTDGNVHTFAEMKGKVIVIDVWATWCHSCLEGMRKFIGMRHRFRNKSDVCFITVSIDRKEDKELWLKAITEHKMQSILNLYPDCDEQSQFETDYQVMGVPRYIVIGKDGKIVSAHAPGPGRELAEMIEDARHAEEYSGSGTTFLTMPIAQAVEKATNEGKHILLEFHTRGCVPCKMMKDKVFAHNRCAEYFNREFVCLSIYDEDGEGPELVEKYNVEMFPTYVILEANGELAGTIIGAETDIDLFIEKTEEIKNLK